MNWRKRILAALAVAMIAAGPVAGAPRVTLDINGRPVSPADPLPTYSPGAANASVPVSVSTATTTQIVAASGSLVIHVQQWVLVATLADNATWESADTGGSCANPVALTGALPFGANGGASVGSGVGDVLVLPAGKALCLLTSAATQISGSASYRQY